MGSAWRHGGEGFRGGEHLSEAGRGAERKGGGGGGGWLRTGCGHTCANRTVSRAARMRGAEGHMWRRPETRQT